MVHTPRQKNDRSSDEDHAHVTISPLAMSNIIRKGTEASVCL
jgi:hypothetical protein